MFCGVDGLYTTWAPLYFGPGTKYPLLNDHPACVYFPNFSAPRRARPAATTAVGGGDWGGGVASPRRQPPRRRLRHLPHRQRPVKLAICLEGVRILKLKQYNIIKYYIMFYNIKL
jgi:hypothetical protein